MKTNCDYRLKATLRGIYGFCLLFVALFVSCNKDEAGGGGYFELENTPPVVEMAAQGATETYTIRASGKWEIQRLHKENWVKVDPLQGDGDGTITVAAARNWTLEPRELSLSFIVDGHRQSNVLKIAQEAGSGQDDDGEQYVLIDEHKNKIDLPDGGGISRHVVRATGKWRMELTEEVNWFHMEPMEGTYDTPVILTVDVNAGAARSVNLNVYLDDELQLTPMPVLQESAIIIFEEYFDWLNYGSPIFYTTTGEKRVDSWTAAEKAKGWTVTPSADGIPSVYARQGFAKLGKTNYGADMISPKLTEVEGTQDLLVRFKAVPYQTEGGARDDTHLYVSVIGPGTVSEDHFDITNWPDYVSDPTCTEIWKSPQTERSFVITGATNETQIRWLGGALDLRENTGAPINKNRIFLDDILVIVKR